MFAVRSAAAVDTDALIIGAGPAGASMAIRLAQAGWRVVLVEQHEYPRHKVCGGCIAAGNLALIDDLGIGPAFRRLAGAELHKVGWMSGAATVEGEFPAAAGPDRFGRALGRDAFDSLLLERARAVGARIVQPARVRAIGGTFGRFECRIEERGPAIGIARAAEPTKLISAATIIDAHGSWEASPEFAGAEQGRRPRRASDLFAFKARFSGASLDEGLLPVLAFAGGYGGMVVAGGGETTLACCIRRDALRSSRALNPQAPAGAAVEATVRLSCIGVRAALQHASRVGPWLSVGPIRPGIRLSSPCGVFRVGNAAGESHPLIGEGISMALESAQLLAAELTRQPVKAIDERRAAVLQRDYAHAWNQHLAVRMRLAALYAHIAMRPMLAAPAGGLLRHWPRLLTESARFAGKARDPMSPLSPMRGISS